MKTDLIIFDLDGTLLYTLEDIADSLNAVLRESGYPIKSLKQVRSYVGSGLEILIEKAVPQESRNEKEL